jgi:lipoate-protein ligase A
VGRCYDHATDYDLVVDGRKLVGSAQRRRRQAFLQHGSIPLSADPGARAATHLGDVLASPPEPARVARALRRAFVAAGARFESQALRPDERALAERLERERYADPAWTAAVP